MEESADPDRKGERPVDFLRDLRTIARDDPEDRMLLERWERLTLVVRCGLTVDQPNRIRLFLASGQRLTQERIARPVPMYLRMLLTLIRTAEDEALPLAWRQLCSEHFDLPLARLRTLLCRTEPSRFAPLVTRIESVRQDLNRFQAC